MIKHFDCDSNVGPHPRRIIPPALARPLGLYGNPGHDVMTPSSLG